MATPNTAATINAWVKEVYADQIHDLIPEGVKLLKAVKFQAGEKELGDSYIQPVALTHDSGFSVGAGAFSLNDYVAAVYAEAQVAGKNLLLRTAVSYDAMAKASNSKKAFMKWSEQIVGNMTSSFTKRLEVLHFYGGSGLAVVETNTTGELLISTASWASGIWAGSEGQILEAFTATSGGSQHDGDLTISAVDLVARTITVTGTSTAVVADDILFYKGFRGNELNGLDKLISNTGSLYNIDASDYALWKGNTYDAAGALTFAKIQAAVALCVAKGLDEKVSCFVSPATYATLNTDMAAFRKTDSSYKASKGENGNESIEFHSVNGAIEIVPSIYVKEGEAFIAPMTKLKRIGSTDVTMRMPGQSEDQLVLQLPTNAGYELRIFYDGNLFCERPAHCAKVSGITNSAA